MRVTRIWYMSEPHDKLVKQIILDSDQNFPNHSTVGIDVSHSIHRCLAIFDAIRILPEGSHRILQILQQTSTMITSLVMQHDTS